VVRNNFLANTLADFNAYVKANDRHLQYGTSGAGISLE
jgi:tripartite-type tricarboxylate transporter receptor subunit TctC